MNALEKIDSIKTALATIIDIRDARKLLSIANGLLVATTKEYKATEKIGEVKEDRDTAYNAAVKAGEIRLLAEAKLGELLKREQEAGRLASQDTGRPKKSSTEGRLILKAIGLDEHDSYRARRIAEHRNMIPTVVAKAIQRGDIPTRKDLEFEIRNFKQKEAIQQRTQEQSQKGDPIGKVWYQKCGAGWNCKLTVVGYLNGFPMIHTECIDPEYERLEANEAPSDLYFPLKGAILELNMATNKIKKVYKKYGPKIKDAYHLDWTNGVEPLYPRLTDAFKKIKKVMSIFELDGVSQVPRGGLGWVK